MQSIFEQLNAMIPIETIGGVDVEKCGEQNVMLDAANSAATRIRRVDEFECPEQYEQVVYNGEHYGPYDDQCVCCNAYLQLTDPRPVDEAFAKSVAAKTFEFPPAITIWEVGGKVSLHREEETLFLDIGPSITIKNPTIGEFWLAMKLFRVEVKVNGGV